MAIAEDQDTGVADSSAPQRKFRIAAALIALVTIVMVAVILLAEPFESSACTAPNGAETPCTSDLASPDDGKDEDLPAAIAVLIVGLILAAGTSLLAPRSGYGKWRTARQERRAQAWAAKRSAEAPAVNDTKDLVCAVSLGFAGVGGAAAAVGVPLILYIVPLGFGVGALAMAIVAAVLPGRYPWWGVVAVVTSVIAISVGVNGYGDYDNRVNQPVEELFGSP